MTTSVGLQSQLNRFAAPRSGAGEPPSVERRTEDSLPTINPTQDSLPQMKGAQDDLERVDEMVILMNEVGSDLGAPDVPPMTRIAEGLTFAAENPASSAGGQPVEAEKPEEHMEPEALVPLPPDVTTVMIRPIPLKCSQRNLKKMLDASGFAGEYDYLYVPMDQRMRANRGFAFVNFNTAASAQRLHLLFHGQIDKRFSTRTTMQVMPAAVQGFEKNAMTYLEKGWCRSSIQPIFMRPFSPALIEKLNQLGLDNNVKQTGPRAANREERRDQANRGGAQRPQQQAWPQSRGQPLPQDRSAQPQVDPLVLEAASKVPDGLLDRLVKMRGEGLAQQLPQPHMPEENLEALARLRGMDLRADAMSHGGYPGHGFNNPNFDPFEVDIFDASGGDGFFNLGQKGADIRQVERWLQSVPMESEMPGQALSKYMAMRHGGSAPGLGHPCAGQGSPQVGRMMMDKAAQVPTSLLQQQHGSGGQGTTSSHALGVRGAVDMGPVRRSPIDPMQLRHPDAMHSDLTHSDLLRSRNLSDPMRGTNLELYASAAVQQLQHQLDAYQRGASPLLQTSWSNATTRRP